MSHDFFRVVIPARYASTRFPGKALAELANRPLIEHVYQRARASAAAEVLVATDDERIAAAAHAFGAEVVMTRTSHQSGTDRVAEVAGIRGWADADVVVNVQGDVPLVPPASINQVAGLLMENTTAHVATLCTQITDPTEYADAHRVKVVFDQTGRALYFSRASIPAVAHGADDDTLPRAWRHIGLYAYRVNALDRLTREDPCYLEMTEKLEQLRALWLGMDIRVGIAREPHGPDVDTPEDLALAARYLSAGDA